LKSRPDLEGKNGTPMLQCHNYIDEHHRLRREKKTAGGIL